MKSSTAAEQKPLIPPRRRSLIHTRKFSKNVAFSFPDSHELIITTPRSVFRWSKDGIVPIFQSATNGIVAARKTTQCGELLALADSQVVLLHDMKKGNEKTYKLKGSDGHVRLLRYAQGTSNLYFTTTLQNAVRAYSLKDDKLLAPSCEHSSPPTVIALSPDSHWLLSASVAPPTILLNHLLLHSPAVAIRPRCSSAAVVAADFHPQRTNIFSLAFADGACAIYDIAHITAASGRNSHEANPACFEIDCEISHIKRLHAIASSTPISNTEIGVAGPGIEHINHGVGEKGIVIAAVALVPGSRAKAVTVGADGKCYVIDFSTEGKKMGSVVRSWHVQGPATSLALLSSSYKPVLKDTQQSYANNSKQLRRRVLVAIGRQDGIVLLYDLGGHLLRDREFSLDGSRVIELEWISTGIEQETGQADSGLAVPSVDSFQQKRKSVGELPGSVVPRAGTVPVIDGANDELGVSLLDSLARVEPMQEPSRQGYVPRPAVNHLDCFNLATQDSSRGEDLDAPKKQDALLNPEKPQSGKLKNSKPLHSKVSPALQASVNCPSSSERLPDQGPILPIIPPRPIRAKGGGPSLSPAKKGESFTSGAVVDSRPDQQGVSDNPSPSRGLTRSGRAKRLDVIAMNHAVAEREHGASKFTTDPDEIVVPTALEEWIDTTTGSRRPIRKLNGKPARMEKRKDRKASTLQPPSSMVSEASNDIVVDWSPASTQLVAPAGSLVPHRLPEIPARTAKSRKKSPRRESCLSKDTVVQWPSFKKGHIFAMPNKPVVGKTQSPSSSNISPSNEVAAAATSIKHNPSSEVSRIPRQPQQPPPPPPVDAVELPPSSPTRPPPPPPAPATFHPTEPRENHTSGHFQLQAKINALRDEIALRFQAQQTWIDAELKDLVEKSLRLEEENRRLQKETEDVRAEAGKRA